MSLTPEEFKEKWQKLSNGLVDNFVLISSENKTLLKRIKELEQQVLYIQSGNVILDDVCLDIRRKYEMEAHQKHIPRS